MICKMILTFDCEDFINNRSTVALYRILDLLDKHNVKGLFFLTGHMTEKISHLPKLVDSLENQEIGYHSSSHTVRPTIIEYTDVESYASARKSSMTRETRHINPITGEPEGKGGIILLRDVFPTKRISSFRAPGYCYSPPHLEALNELGVKFDFSTNISQTSFCFKNTTFYPFPSLVDRVKAKACAKTLKLLVKNRLSVLAFHPNSAVNARHWDSLYYHGNPERLFPTPAKTWEETKSFLRRFELVLIYLRGFERMGVLEITTKLESGKRKQELSRSCIVRSYNESVWWPRNQLGYTPKFIFKHFKEFFSLQS